MEEENTVVFFSMVCILIEETENLRRHSIYYEQECRVEMASIAIDEEISNSSQLVVQALPPSWI